MRLWNPKETISKFDLDIGDEYKICEQFSKKISCLKNGEAYTPNLAKNFFLGKSYEAEPMNLHEFCNRENCVRSIQCIRLRKQCLDLLSYTKEQTAVIEELVEKYNEETNPKTKLAIKGLARIKASNLKIMEDARKNIIAIFEKAQEAGDFLNKMVNFVKKERPAL